jgi:hypothetical protein
MSSSTPHLQTLIAHYLATNYPAVLPTFLSAAQIATPDLSRPPNPDLRTLVTDYASHHLAQQVAHMALVEDQVMEPSKDGSWRGWTLKNMIELEMDEGVRLGGLKRSIEGISASNLITVGAERIPKRVFDTASASYVYLCKACICVADRR